MSTLEIQEAIKRMKRFFDPHIHTVTSRWRILENYLDIVTYDSRSTINKPGKKEKKLRFILSGCAVKLVERAENEECLDIYFEDEFLSDIKSLHAGTVSEVYFRCIEPVVVAEMKKTDVFVFYDNSPIGAQLGRVIAEQEIVKMENRTTMLSAKIELSYNKIREERPEIVQRIPQVYLATYLGTSPQSLSRIRKSR